MIPEKRLHESGLFKDWKKNHQSSFLSHYFSALSPEFKLKGDWEAGFYIPEDDKMTVFVLSKEISIKPEDQIFKKPGDKVEKLEWKKVKTFFEDALKIFREEYPKLFPKKVLGDGFIVLQTIEGKTLWNFTFITKTLEFINIKIDASSGKIESHQTVELIDKK